MSVKLSALGRTIDLSGTSKHASEFGDALLDNIITASSATIFGDAGNDSLVVTSGAAYGGVGDDTFFHAGGSNTIDGGVGSDLVRYEGATALTISGTRGVQTLRLASGEVDVLQNIETLSLGAGNDSVSASDGVKQVILLGGGDNTVAGGDGDTIRLGSGNDSIGGGDVLLDFSDWKAGVNALIGRYAGDGATKATNSLGQTATLDPTLRNMIGTNFDDTIAGGSAYNNLFYGGGGNDLFYSGWSGGGSDTMYGGAGDDKMNGGTGADLFSGDSGNDNLDGGGGADTLFGGDGDDTLVGGAGADSLDGGAGANTLSYLTSGSAVTVNLQTKTAAGGDAQGDVFRNFANLQGSYNADSLTGDGAANVLSGEASNDTISGGAGDDTIYGGSGDDVLEGGAGADSIDGGSGYNVASYRTSTTGVSIDMKAGAGYFGDAQGDTYFKIFGVIGSQGNDTLVGDGWINSLIGGAGDDVIRQTLVYDYDTLDGGVGRDTLDYSGDGQTTKLRAGSVDTGIVADLTKGTVYVTPVYYDLVTNFEDVIGTSWRDSIVGDAGANLFDGGWANDTLIGGAGDDTLLGGLGADSMDGGDGVDLISYAGSSVGVSFNFETGAYAGGDAAGDTFVNIEGVIGSSNADTFVGGGGNDVFMGGAGDDLVKQRLTWDFDTLDGGAGIDTLDYSGDGTATGARPSGFDTGITADLIAGRVYVAGTIADSVSNFENVVGTFWRDSIAGDANANRLSGGAGDDTLQGGSGADSMDGAAGFDLISYDAATVGVTVNLATGTGAGGDAQGDVFSNFEGVIGSSRADSIKGDAGDNRLDGGAGADTFDGGAGIDTLTYERSLAGVTVNLATGAGGGGDAAGDKISNVENVVGTAQNDSLVGDAGANALTGAGGADTLDGGAGADTLSGGLGSDVLTGGAGDDVIVETLSWDYDTIDGGVGVDTLDYSGDGQTTKLRSGGVDTGIVADLTSGRVNVTADKFDVVSNFENVVGTSWRDLIVGDAGANRLDGGWANDTLKGGAGADTLIGGLGQDSMDGGDGFDILSYAGSNAGVTVNLNLRSASGGDAGGDAFVNVEGVIGSSNGDSLVGTAPVIHLDLVVGNDYLDGGDGADTIDGNGGFDSLYGGAGDDMILSGYGFSIMEGGAGADTLRSWNYTDTLSYSRSKAGVNIDLQAKTASGGDAQGDVFNAFLNVVGSANADTIAGDWSSNRIEGGAGSDVITDIGGDDVIFGGDGDDTITAGNSPNYAGNKTVDGGAGNDVIQTSYRNDTVVGGAGDDTITTGAGWDVLLYKESSFGKDVIKDFQQGADTLWISSSVVADWTSLLSKSSYSSAQGGLLIAVDDQNQILLKGVTALQRTDVAFL